MWPSLLLPDDDPATAPPVPSTGAQLAATLTPAIPQQANELATIGGLLDDNPRIPKLTEFHSLATGLVTTKPIRGGRRRVVHAHRGTDAGAELCGDAGARQASDAQGRPNPFAQFWSGGRELLRTMAYYEMKNRAGVVGKNGLGPLLAGLTGPRDPRIHLMGHSFGARLVSYALAGLPAAPSGTASPIKSLTLIQGAFSHFAFASTLPFDGGRGGELAGHGAKVDGPLLATFTAADRAVGWWYPAASFLARQDTESADDVTYRWGAMGHDGYQSRPHARHPVGPDGTSYGFAPGQFYTLDANAVINDQAVGIQRRTQRHPPP